MRVKIHEWGNFGPEEIRNLGFNCTALNACRDILKNDLDLMHSSLVSKQTKMDFHDMNVDVSTLGDEKYEFYVGKVLWGTLRFLKD